MCRDGGIFEVLQPNLFEQEGLELSPSSAEDFPVSLSALPGSSEALKMTVSSGRKCVELYRNSSPLGVLGENVPGIIPLALDQVLVDLEGLGYSCQTFNIPACAVDTPHRRARIFIVANASSNLRRTSRNEGSGSFDGSCSNVANAESQQNIQRGRSDLDETIRRRESFNSTAFLSSEDVAYSNNSGLQVTGLESRESKISSTFGTQYGGWWPTEPDVGRVAHGVPARVDRLKCLGNAVVPQQVYPILKAIAEIEGAS
jgi:DNA (cytosine-5)-methyltransferase 1